MGYLGSFHAQHFEWFNRDMGSMEIGKDVDVNTIYEFFVFSDRLLLFRSGNVVNDMKRMLNGYITSLGVRAVAEAPSGVGDEAQALDKARELLRSHKLNREILLSTLTICEVRKRHLQYLAFHGSVVLKYPDGRKAVYRFRNPGESEQAWSTLQKPGTMARMA
jgi:hypothetical protein